MKAWSKLLNLYEMSKPKKQGIDSLAYIAPSAKIGENVYIGAFAYIAKTPLSEIILKFTRILSLETV